MTDTLLRQLEDDVAEFLSYIDLQRGLAKNTVLTYHRALNRYAQFARDGGVADYLAPQAAELACYVEGLHGMNLAASTRSLAVTALRMLYTRLIVTGRTTQRAARPVTILKGPPIPKRLPNVLSVEQVRRLLDAPDRTNRMFLMHRSLMELLYASGCRASEAASLVLADVDLAAGTARVIGKGGRARVLLFGEVAAQWLYAYVVFLRPELAVCLKEPPPWLFLTKSGRQLPRKLVYMLVNRHAVRVGLPSWVGAHSLRHAAATHLIQGGADVRFAQELLGHYNVEMTQTYLHLDVAHLRGAYDRFLQYRGRLDSGHFGAGQESPFDPCLLPVDLPAGYWQWSEIEDHLIRTLSIREAQTRTGRTKYAIELRRIWLLEPAWTAEEDVVVANLSMKEAAIRLRHRKPYAIIQRRLALGIASHREH